MLMSAAAMQQQRAPVSGGNGEHVTALHTASLEPQEPSKDMACNKTSC
jgi:hypothetical protein